MRFNASMKRPQFVFPLAVALSGCAAASPPPSAVAPVCSAQAASAGQEIHPRSEPNSLTAATTTSVSDAAAADGRTQSDQKSVRDLAHKSCGELVLDAAAMTVDVGRNHPSALAVQAALAHCSDRTPSVQACREAHVRRDVLVAQGRGDNHPDVAREDARIAVCDAIGGQGEGR